MISEDQLDKDQISKLYRKKYEKTLELQGYAYMLYEDLSLGSSLIMDGKANIRLNTEDKALIKKVISIYSHWSRYSSDNVKDFVCQLTEDIGRSLANYGKSVFELVKSSYEDYYNYKIVPLFYLDDVRIGRKDIIQKCYLEDEKDGKSKFERIKIPKGKCFALNFPKELGGRKSYLRILKYLSSEGNLVSLGQLELKKLAGKFNEYDFINHSKLVERISWRMTKELGWNHRRLNKTSTDCGFEHYLVSRALRFKSSNLILRDYIIKHINEIIEKVSELYGNKVSLIIDGLIQINEIDVIIKKWNSPHIQSIK